MVNSAFRWTLRAHIQCMSTNYTQTVMHVLIINLLIYLIDLIMRMYENI